MQGIGNDAVSSPPPDILNGAITIPALSGTIGHIRQKPSRVGLGERQYSYDVTTGPSARIVTRTNPSPPPPIHHRQYSEGAGGEKSASLTSARNASVSSLDTYQTFNAANSSDMTALAMSGGRRRHGHGHSHAHSHHHHPSHPSPVPSKPASMMSIFLLYSWAKWLGTSEYALHILFTNFVRIVEDMFAKFMAIPVDVEPDISAHFGPGADPAFDKVLTSLGHIGSHKPTPVINTVMYWRAHKAKNEDGNIGNRSLTPSPANVPPAAAAAITAGMYPNTAITPIPALPSVIAPLSSSTPPSLMRRQTEPTVNTLHGQEMGSQYTSQRAGIAQHILKDRQNRCAIYILCRALIEVVKHTTADALTEDVASKIEPIVFKELIAQDAESYYKAGSIKSANWNIFAELLGCFSSIRLSS
jgi:Cell morphogenesis N-terminal